MKEEFWHGYRRFNWGWRNPYLYNYKVQQQINLARQVEAQREAREADQQRIADLNQRLNEEENTNRKLQDENNKNKNLFTTVGFFGLLGIGFLFLVFLVLWLSKRPDSPIQKIE